MGRDGAGPAIAAAPILTLVRRWLTQGVDDVGAMPAAGLVNLEQMKPELVDCNVVLVRQ